MRLIALLFALAGCTTPVTTTSHAYGAFWCVTAQTRHTQALGCGRTLPQCERIRSGMIHYSGLLDVDAVTRCSRVGVR